MNFKINISLIALAWIFFVSCEKKEVAHETAGKPENPEVNHVWLTKAQIENLKLKTGTFEKREIRNIVKANGYIDLPPDRKAEINSFLPGYVRKADLLVGDYVKKGQVVAQLENPDYLKIQESYLDATSQLKFLENEYQRQQTLSEENISSQKKFLETEANYKSLLARKKMLESQLRMLGLDTEKVEEGQFSGSIYLRSPIEGYISKVGVSLGKHIGPAELVYEVINLDHLHLELDVFEKDIHKLAKDQPINFTISSEPDKIRQAEIYLIGRNFRGEQRTVNVHGHIKEEDLAGLMVGMFVEASIVVGNQPVDVLPEKAIVKDGHQNFIFVQDETEGQSKGFSRVEVSVGNADQGWVEVNPLEEISPDVKIVTDGAFYLTSALENEG